MPAVTDKLVAPPVVRKYLDSLAGRPDYPPDVLAEIEQGLTLSYHHGGRCVVCDTWEEVREVLFVGTDAEVGAWLESVNLETYPNLFIDRPYTWEQTRREYGLSE